MGCNTSVNSSIIVRVEFTSPGYKSETLTEKCTIRTTLKEFCQKIIQSNIEPALISRMTYQITYKDKEYSIKDQTRLCDLRVTPEDSIKINAVLSDQRVFDLIIKYYTANPKEEKKQVNRSTLISSIIPKSDYKVLLGHLELDHDQTLDDYDILNKTRLIVVEDFSEFPEIQAWKIKKSGLVLEALCMNIDCQAYKQRICVNLGLGEFNINSEVSQDCCRECVSCGSYLGSVCKVSFVHCIVSYSAKSDERGPRDVVVRVKNSLEDTCKNWTSNVKITKFV